jgi:hypothetical protein
VAGIEKICEYSGDYPGGKMYGYKRNHIQICPKYRPLFRGATAHVEIVKVEKQFVFKSGGYTDVSHAEDFGVNRGRVMKEYTFRLVVEDPILAGDVGGVYVNWTFNMRQTLKRLKRMLRCRNLKVVYKLEDKQ